VIFLYAKPARGCQDEREKNRLAGMIAKKKKKKELQTGGNVFKTQMNSTMLINLTTGLFHMA
jgi:hypothetical protein